MKELSLAGTSNNAALGLEHTPNSNQSRSRKRNPVKREASEGSSRLEPNSKRVKFSEGKVRSDKKGGIDGLEECTKKHDDQHADRGRQQTRPGSCCYR